MDRRGQLRVAVLALGVFGIINMEMGVVGILPAIAEAYGVSVTSAGLLVSLFALVVAVSGPTLPLLLSRFNRKTMMVVALSLFLAGSLVSAFAPTFEVLLAARVVPAFFQPVYVSLAFSEAAASVALDQAPRATAKINMGVSAGMVMGVPAASAIASALSVQAAMLFFAAVIALVLVVTVALFPSMPSEGARSYGEQLGALKSANTWLAILAVVFMNGSIYGVYSYVSDYLGGVPGFAAATVSVLLLVYGLANLVGNAIAGRVLATRPLTLVFAFPVLLVAVYLALRVFGGMAAVCIALLVAWGVLGGINASINQYWVTSSIPDAPEFANGVFLAAANLGSTVGTSLGGVVLASAGTANLPFTGIIMVIVAAVVLSVQVRPLGRLSEIAMAAQR